MDVSIAVSLIRGQMGAVVERAVNGAVETVLAEMLKVVGVKFEELKSQVALMKRDMTVLQRDKALKEKENENIRAKLRYTELKLKYYRQGVEEELQQRVTASGLVPVGPTSGQTTGQTTGQNAGQRGATGVSHIEATPSCSGQTRTGTTSTSPQSSSSSSSSNSGHGARVFCGTSIDSSDLLQPVSVSTRTEGVDNNTGSSGHKNEEEELEWAITLQPNTEEAMTSIQILSFESGQQSNNTLDQQAHADSSTLPSSPPTLKQESPPDEEVICIKEEPDEEQDVAAMFDCQLQQSLQPKTEAPRNVTDWSAPLTSGRNLSAAGYLMSQPAGSMPSVSASFLGPRQGARPWIRPDLSLYEEYKRRRNELRRASMNKRRELEKTLPQPLLSDMIRERREKTRLRVAKWRAKRKLQACLNQAQAQGGAAGLPQVGGQIDSNNELLRATCAQTSSPQQQQRQSPAMHLPNNFICNMSGASSLQPSLPFLVPSSSPCSLLMRGGPSVSSQGGQHIVTSSSNYSQMNFTQQTISINETEIIE